MKHSTYCDACGFAMSALDDTCPRCRRDREEAKGVRADLKPAMVGPGAATGAAPLAVASPTTGIPPWLLFVAAGMLGASAAIMVVWALLTPATSMQSAQPGAGALVGALPTAPSVSAPGGRGLPHSEALPTGLPSGIGELFRATPSRSPVPVIDMRNASERAVHVTFLGPADVTRIIPPWSSVQFELPQGMYHVRVWARDTRQREGTAMFRRLTRYDCTWEIVTTPDYYTSGPLRLGDPH